MGWVLAKTVNGGDQYELMSCLHKALRRGEELLAMRVAVEFLNSAEVAETKACAMMLFNYLITVAHEDIGVADPGVVTFVNTTVAQAVTWHKAGKLKDVGNLVANCIVLMCRAMKARYGGNLESYARHLNTNQGLPEIPDFAFDMHTRKGRALGRGQQHFMDEGETLASPHPDFTGDNDPWKKKMDPIWLKQYPTRGGAVQGGTAGGSGDGDEGEEGEGEEEGEDARTPPPLAARGKKPGKSDAGQGKLF